MQFPNGHPRCIFLTYPFIHASSSGKSCFEKKWKLNLPRLWHNEKSLGILILFDNKVVENTSETLRQKPLPRTGCMQPIVATCVPERMKGSSSFLGKGIELPGYPSAAGWNSCGYIGKSRADLCREQLRGRMQHDAKEILTTWNFLHGYPAMRKQINARRITCVFVDYCFPLLPFAYLQIVVLGPCFFRCPSFPSITSTKSNWRRWVSPTVVRHMYFLKWSFINNFT